MQLNFLTSLVCPLTDLKDNHFFSIHQLPTRDSKSMPATQQPWRDMLFTRPPTQEVHVLTGVMPVQPSLLDWKPAEDVQTTTKIMPDYQHVTNSQGVTLGEVADAAGLGNRDEPFAVILGEMADADLEEARAEFRDVLRRQRKMKDIAILRSAQIMFSDW